MRRATTALLTGFAVLIAGQAFAQGPPSRVSVAVDAGIDLPFSLFNTGAETTGLFGTDRLLEHAYPDVFRPSLVAGGGIDVGLTRRSELILRARVTRAAGRADVLFGESISRFPPASRAIFATVGDFRSVAVEAGVRRRLAGEGHVAPFVGATAGVASVAAVRSDYTCPTRSGSPDCGLTTASVVPVLSGLAGVSIPATRHVQIEVEAAIRWQLGVAQDPAVSAGYLAGSFTGQRVSIPVTGALRYAF